MTSLPLQYTLLGLAGGDLWSRVTSTNKTQLRHLLSGAAAAVDHVGFRRLADFLSQASPCSRFSYGTSVWDTVEVNNDTVEVVGQDGSRRIMVAGEPRMEATRGGVLLIDGTEGHLTDADNVDVFDNTDVLPIPVAVHLTIPLFILRTDLRPPAMITSDGAVVMAGVDYSFSDTGLLFLEDPRDLLGPKAATLWCVVPRGHCMSFIARAQLRGGSGGVTGLLRKAESPQNLAESIANVAGFYWARVADVVQGVTTALNGVTYDLQKAGRIWVDYPHKHLIAGEEIAANTAIGSPFVMLTADSAHDDTWYQSITFGDVTGESFIPALPFEILIEDADVPYTSVAMLSGVGLSGSGLSSSFARWLKKQDHDDQTFASFCGFSGNGQTLSFRLIYEMLRYGGWRSWCVIKTYQWEDWPEEVRADITRFLDHHKSAGTVVLRVDHDTTIQDPVSISAPE